MTNEQSEIAYFAAGCFWGVEYYFNKQEGVLSAISGYMGGNFENPTYKDICYKKTNHLEVVKVTFDKNKINFKELCKLFFEIHNFTQLNGQGPDIGDQYLSAIFANNKKQEEIAQKLIEKLTKKGYEVATKIFKAKNSGPAKFWRGEEYHQNYYQKNGQEPYCHFRKKIF